MASRSVNRLLLPSERALQSVANQGWKFPTVVGQSQIPGAGNGRFALEAVPRQTRVLVKPYVPMTQIEKLASLPADRCISFESADDVEKYVELSMREGGYSRKRVLQELSNFMWGYDGRRACLNNSTWSMNHADDGEYGLNIDFIDRRLPDGTLALVGETKKEVSTGDELNNNYREFVLPDFYLAWCRDNRIKDVRTVVMEAVDGPLVADSVVEVFRPFTSSTQIPVDLEAGTKGQVLSVLPMESANTDYFLKALRSRTPIVPTSFSHSNGMALIRFDGVASLQWVSSLQFANLRVNTAEDVLCDMRMMKQELDAENLQRAVEALIVSDDTPVVMDGMDQSSLKMDQSKVKLAANI